MEENDGWVKIILKGRPITKKNHQQIIKNKKTGKPMVIQSSQYQDYESSCLWMLNLYRGKVFEEAIQVKALYWMPNKQGWPDLMGLLQTTCDILEKGKVIKNDRLVVSLDGSRICGIDKENPRVEIYIRKEGETNA